MRKNVHAPKKEAMKLNVITIVLFLFGFALSPAQALEAKKIVAKVGTMLEPFSPNQTWTVTEGETLTSIWTVLHDNNWAIAGTAKDFEQAVKAINANLDPNNLPVGFPIKLLGLINVTTNDQKQECLRQILLLQTGHKIELTPVADVTQQKLALVSAAAPNGAGIAKSTLLALWEKEGTLYYNATKVINTADPDAAKTTFREYEYFNWFGADYFTLYQPTKDDNKPVPDPAQAAARFTTRASAFGGAGVPTAIMAELDTGPVQGKPAQLTVTPTNNFFVLSLGLVARYFQSKLVQEGPDITYMKYNMGDAGFALLVKRGNADPKRTALGILTWAIHSPIVKNEYDDPRKKAIRFYFIRQCYLQYDAASP